MAEFSCPPDPPKAQLNKFNQSVAYGNTPVKLPIQGSTPLRSDTIAGRRKHDGQNKQESDDYLTQYEYKQVDADAKQDIYNNSVAEYKTPLTNRVHPSKATKASDLYSGPEESTPRSNVPTPLNKLSNGAVNNERADFKTPKNEPTAPAVTRDQSEALFGKQPVDEVNSLFLWTLVPESLILHSSETQVKPIVGNKSIEALEDIECPEQVLSFSTYRMDGLKAMKPPDLEQHLNQVRGI